MTLEEDARQFLDDEIKGYLKAVEVELQKHIKSDTKLEEIVSYLLNADGKRLRPALLIIAYKAVGGEEIEEVVPISAAIELIHTATLIHDDINDDNDFRRGQETTNRKYGTLNAIVGGDFLFVQAFRVGGTYPWDVIRMIADACRELAEGEVIQNSNRYNTGETYEIYQEIIRMKTASLITGSLKVGCYLGGGSEEAIQAMADYGYGIGMIFQITDDILDVEGDVEKTGKPLGSDIREGQLTILAIRALETLPDEERDELAGILSRVEHSEEEVGRALDLIKSTDAVEYAYEQTHHYADVCRQALEHLPESDYRDRLELGIGVIMTRNY